jgi:hypothetical protein
VRSGYLFFKNNGRVPFPPPQKKKKKKKLIHNGLGPVI